MFIFNLFLSFIIIFIFIIIFNVAELYHLGLIYVIVLEAKMCLGIGFT